VVALALLSPLHHYAERLLWVHMVQHEALMVVAAPLLVLGRPIEAWSWALRGALMTFRAHALVRRLRARRPAALVLRSLRRCAT
jgi:putative membrane protein